MLDNIEKIVKIIAIIIGGAWVYLKAIRGRMFIPRLQLLVSGKLMSSNGNKYLLVDTQVQNIGSSMAMIKEEGTALKITALQAFGSAPEMMDLTPYKLTAFPIFDMHKKDIIVLEPGTNMHSQEVIEVPDGKYDAYRIELRVSALHGNIFNRKNRKWRAFSIALSSSDNELRSNI